jgi:hypothetical protein
MTGARATRLTGLSTTAVVVAGVLVSGYLWLRTRTTTIDLTPAAAAAEVVVGLLWFAAGAVVGVMRPGNRIAWLLLLAGALWFVQASRLSNNAGLFAMASAVGAAYLIVALHIALALPDGRLHPTTAHDRHTGHRSSTSGLQLRLPGRTALSCAAGKLYSWRTFGTAASSCRNRW